MSKLTQEEKDKRKRFNVIRSMLRRAWSRDPERYAVLNNNKRVYKGPNKRQKVEYKCNMCLNYFKGSDITVDHIIACGSFKCDADWNTFVPRLFCLRDGLQLLCDKCHNIKTNEERKVCQKD